jgi:multidrug resistance efflux pump
LWIRHPEPTGSRRATPLGEFQQAPGHPGQRVEVALDPYPGQIFEGEVDQIWRANAAGQYLPSDVLPAFDAADPHQVLGQFAVRINLEGNDQERFPIGAHGVAAIYTRDRGGFAVLRRISIRAHSWLNWLYPLNV